MRRQTKIKKTVLITGCSRGIGYAAVELLASKNFLIYAGVRSLLGAEKLKALAKSNPNIKIVEIDLKKEASIKKLAKKIKKEGILIDILINNAGVIVFGPIETVSMHQVYDQFQVNLFGPILLTQQLLPQMRQRKKGHIVFLGSTSGAESHGMYGVYAASKFALEAICHSLAVNLYHWGIKVSLVELSATATSLAKDSIEIGSQLKGSQNPYAEYTQKQLAFLQSLLANGMPPKKVAATILDAIENPKNNLRYFASKKAKKIFEDSLKDYLGIKWQDQAMEESLLF